MFTDWVSEKIEERNEEVREKKDINIELDPDIAVAFTSLSHEFIFDFIS